MLKILEKSIRNFLQPSVNFTFYITRFFICNVSSIQNYSAGSALARKILLRGLSTIASRMHHASKEHNGLDFHIFIRKISLDDHRHLSRVNIMLSVNTIRVRDIECNFFFIMILFEILISII